MVVSRSRPSKAKAQATRRRTVQKQTKKNKDASDAEEGDQHTMQQVEAITKGGVKAEVLLFHARATKMKNLLNYRTSKECKLVSWVHTVNRINKDSIASCRGFIWPSYTRPAYPNIPPLEEE